MQMATQFASRVLMNQMMGGGFHPGVAMGMMARGGFGSSGRGRGSYRGSSRGRGGRGAPRLT